jgi:hypothetical protein
MYSKKEKITLNRIGLLGELYEKSYHPQTYICTFNPYIANTLKIQKNVVNHIIKHGEFDIGSSEWILVDKN